MLRAVFGEPPSVKDCFIISLREGMIVTAKMTVNAIFVELLSALKEPEKLRKKDLESLVNKIRSGITTLFGENAAGACRLGQ